MTALIQEKRQWIKAGRKDRRAANGEESSGDWQGTRETGKAEGSAVPREGCQARQARVNPLWGDSDLTSAFPSWSRQHNPVSEHLHCLNFILWCCLLIGQTWLTASEVQSDRQGASRTTAQNSSGEGEQQLHAGSMQLRPADVCRKAWGWPQGGRAQDEAGGGHGDWEVGQAQPPK